MDALTINDENRLKRENVKLAAEVTEIQSLKAQMKKQTEEMVHYRNQAAQFSEMISHLGPAIDMIMKSKPKAPESQSM